MLCNATGIAIIREFESCSLTAYPDPESELARRCRAINLKASHFRLLPDWQSLKGTPWTVGWGHTGRDIGPQTVWTAPVAEEAFRHDIASVERQVEHAFELDEYRFLPNSNQFSAMVSLCYNCGIGNFLKMLHAATLFSGTLTADGIEKAARELYHSHGHPDDGLIRRRKAEIALFRGTTL